MITVRKRCQDALIKFADMHVISAMSVCIKEGIDAEKYLNKLAEMAEIEDEDGDFGQAVKAATEGYKLSGSNKHDEVRGGRIPTGGLE